MAFGYNLLGYLCSQAGFFQNSALAQYIYVTSPQPHDFSFDGTWALR